MAWIKSSIIAQILLFMAVTVRSDVPTARLSGTAAMARLRKDLLAMYDPYSRPCVSNSENTTITLGLSPISITKVDEKKSILYLEAFIKMVWQDETLKWEPNSYDDITLLHLPPHEIWKPDIAIYSGPGDDALAIKSLAPILVENTGKVSWIPPITIKSYCGDFNFAAYPNDRQMCTVTLGSWTHSGLTIDLVPYKSEDVSMLINNNPTWKYEDMTTERRVEHYPCCQEPYINMKFNVSMTRRGSEGQIATGLVRNTLLILVLAMFWVPPIEGSKKLIPGVTALLGLILLMTVTTVTAPSIKVLRYAIFPLKMSGIFATVAILIELLVVCIVHSSSNFPPLTALGSVLNSKAIKVLVVNSCRSAEGVATSRNTIIPEDKGAEFKNWPLVATLIDRLSFLIFTILFVVICSLW